MLFHSNLHKWLTIYGDNERNERLKSCLSNRILLTIKLELWNKRISICNSFMCDWHHYWAHLGSITLSSCLKFDIFLLPSRSLHDSWYPSVCLCVWQVFWQSNSKVMNRLQWNFQEMLTLFHFDDVPDSRWYFDHWPKNKSKGLWS